MAGLFALTDRVVGNLQMATFATFGAIATLVLTSFSGTRRERLAAHLGLALAGSALLTLGTMVSSPVALAAVATVPLTFVVLFAGIAGPNAAAGATGAILAFVLPAASAGTLADVPSRLAGWWLASVAGTAFVLAFVPVVQRADVRGAISRLADALSDQLGRALHAPGDGAALAAVLDAKRQLILSAHQTAASPLGLRVGDRALANLIDLLEWCASAVADAARDETDLSTAASPYRDVLELSASTLGAVGSRIGGDDAPIDPGPLDRARQLAASRLVDDPPGEHATDADVRLAFHAQLIGGAVFAASTDAILATSAGSTATTVTHREGDAGYLPTTVTRRRLTRILRNALRNSNLRSVWFVNSLRGSVALAAAVAAADLTDVQHGFWVVLGTLSVLRTNASATGSTAARALAGTVLGFVIGGALLVVIGTDTTVLWLVLPFAVFVAAYTPGTAPLAIGQAAFTVLVAIVFNLIVPVGWQVGVIRIEDVTIGCLVSVAAGVLLWPRGVVSVISSDLADAYVSAGTLLVEAVEWCTGVRRQPPQSGAASSSAALRLDDALRSFSAEGKARNITGEELQHLVGGTLRLRLTAQAIAALPARRLSPTDETLLRRRTSQLTAWYRGLGSLLTGQSRDDASLPAPAADSDATRVAEVPGTPYAQWLCEHLDHLAARLDEIIVPARHLIETNRAPWWR